MTHFWKILQKQPPSHQKKWGKIFSSIFKKNKNLAEKWPKTTAFFLGLALAE
jgi:hypothetical protein